MEAVEERGCQGQGPAQLVDLELAPEAAHRHLKGTGPAVLVQGEHLSVQDQRGGGQGAGRLDHLRHTVGDVGQVASEHPHLLGPPVELDAGTIQLPLQRGRADPGECIGDAVSRLRQHRLERPEELQAKGGEPTFAAGQGGLSHRPQVAAQHQGPAHRGCRYRRGTGHRLHHHALERPLAKLAEDESDQEVLLGLSGATEELIQESLPLCLGPRSGHPAQPSEAGVDLSKRERRPHRRFDRLTKRGVPDTEAPLAEHTRQQSHADGDLFRIEPAEDPRQQVDLDQPARVCRHLCRDVHDVA